MIKNIQETCPDCLKAPTGCCSKHSMNCPVCDGEGSVSMEKWNKFVGKQSNDNFIRDALYHLQTHDRNYEIRIWFDGSHYDHGEEPAIIIFHRGVKIYSEWGISLPDLIIEAGEFMKHYKPKD